MLFTGWVAILDMLFVSRQSSITATDVLHQWTAATVEDQDDDLSMSLTHASEGNPSKTIIDAASHARRGLTDLDPKSPHSYQQYQSRMDLLIPPPSRQTTPLPSIHCATSSRALVPIKGPRHILVRPEAAALMGVLDASDCVAVVGFPQTLPPLEELAC